MTTSNIKLIIVSTVIFFILLPLSLKIDFYQNDDWVYYLNVDWFLHGNFTLHSYMGPTFYTQGLLSAVFAYFFTLARLPVLTLVFSVADFYLIAFLCMRYFKKSVFSSVLLALIAFVTPMHIYSTLGFMSGCYFLFFMLVTIVFYLQYLETPNMMFIVPIVVFSLISLFARQVGLILPIGIGLHLLLQKKYKVGLTFVLLFILEFIYITYLFPVTDAMNGAKLQFHHLASFKYSFALGYGILIVLSAILLPLFINAIDYKLLMAHKFKLGVILLLAASLYLYFSSIFSPHEVSWGEFPYFENTFERTGFYPRGLAGTKYQFKGNYDLFYYWDLAAKLILVFYLSYTVLYKKIKLNIFSILISVYMFVMLLTETFYDRYILVFIPLVVLYFASTDIQTGAFFKLSSIAFLICMTFLLYQFATDFVLVNKYVWNKSVQLVKESSVDERVVFSTNAWRLNFPNNSGAYKYIFTYDSPEINKYYADNFMLLEKKTITFPFSIFIRPDIYLFEAK